MKVLVTGAGGQLGHDILKALKNRGIEYVAPSSSEMDIRDMDAVGRIFGREKPDACMHAAAWTRVDDAEDHPLEAEAVNVTGTRNLALAALRAGAKFMYFSTDYVFDGSGDALRRPNDETHPLGVYGTTKLMGEKEVLSIIPDESFVVRLEWVYGLCGHNFVKTMLRLASGHDTLSVVDDQIGSPSYTADLAELSADMIMTERFGIYHAANEGYVSWCGFAKAIMKLSGNDHVEVVPISSDEYPQKARRPLNSRFDTSLLPERGFRLLPDWHDALRRFLTELYGSEPQLFPGRYSG